MYAECPNKVGTPKYLEKYKFLQKSVSDESYMVQKYLFTDPISLTLGCVARSRLH